MLSVAAGGGLVGLRPVLADVDELPLASERDGPVLEGRREPGRLTWSLLWTALSRLRLRCREVGALFSSEPGEAASLLTRIVTADLQVWPVRGAVVDVAELPGGWAPTMASSWPHALGTELVCDLVQWTERIRPAALSLGACSSPMCDRIFVAVDGRRTCSDACNQHVQHARRRRT